MAAGTHVWGPYEGLGVQEPPHLGGGGPAPAPALVAPLKAKGGAEAKPGGAAAAAAGPGPGERPPMVTSSGRTLPSAFLSVGQAFQGTQHVSHNCNAAEEAWKVTVQFQEVDLQRGYICGSMEAYGFSSGPHSSTSIVTFWEGDIIDNVNSSFFTSRWGASHDTDMDHWTRFKGFAGMKEGMQALGKRKLDVASSPHIFMRWKEKFFVNVGPECGLTIAGFYYACLDRSTGRIEGFYYDPNSSPYQKLELTPTLQGRNGYSFAGYQFQ